MILNNKDFGLKILATSMVEIIEVAIFIPMTEKNRAKYYSGGK